MSHIPLFWKFLLLRQESNDITFRKAQPVHCTFQGIVCPKPYFFFLICHFANSMSKSDFF